MFPYNIGLSYYNGVAYAYMNGCFHGKSSHLTDSPHEVPIIEGIKFESADIRVDVQLDEVYLWEVRQPARVLNILNNIKTCVKNVDHGSH